MTTYQDAHPTYRRLGWPSLLPLRPGTKWPPPDGFTGWDGINPSFADCLDWEEDTRYRCTSQTALRMPSTVVGIDVDAYDEKTGGSTLAEAERRWGALPAGPWSSARDDGISGIKFHRVPDGTVLVANLGFPDLKIGHVEVIQRHHRYAAVWPSTHPTARTLYTWRGTAGPYVPPAVADLPALPARWLAELASAASRGERAQAGQVTEFMAALPAGSACPSVLATLRNADAALRSPTVSRHDDTCAAVLRLLRLGEQGHPGTAHALAALKVRFTRVVTEDSSRTYASAIAEFDRMVDGDRGIGLLLASPTDPSRQGCRCSSQGSTPSRALLAGMLRKVLNADSDDQPRLLGWATRKLRDYASAGQLEPDYVDTVVAQLRGAVGGGAR